MKIFLIYISCFFFPLIGNSQQIVRERVYKLDANAKGFTSSFKTKQGNIVYAGLNSTTPCCQNVILMAQPNADTLWTRTSPSMGLRDMSIIETPSGGFAFLRSTRQVGTSNGETDGLFQHLNNSGFIKWSKIYNFSDFEKIDRILTAPDSGFFIGGETRISGGPGKYFLARTDSLGNVKWQKNYDGSPNDYLADMKYNPQGEIVMAGRTSSPITPFYPILKMLVVNQNGDTIRSRRLAIISHYRSQMMIPSDNSVTPLSDGGYLLTAVIDTNVNLSIDYKMGMVIKTDANLQPVWHYIKRQAPEKQHNFTKAKELVDNTLLVLAYEKSYVYPFPSNRFFLYHFSATGTLLNTYTFTSSLGIDIRTLTLDALADSTFIIGGGMTVAHQPNVIGSLYIAKVKIPGLPLPLSPFPIVNSISKVSVLSTSLGQSYPNPTAASAIIPYTLPQYYTKASILIREIATGREIKRYELKRNSSSLNVDLSQLSNGLYLYSLVVDEQPVATKKLAVMK